MVGLENKKILADILMGEGQGGRSCILSEDIRHTCIHHRLSIIYSLLCTTFFPVCNHFLARPGMT